MTIKKDFIKEVVEDSHVKHNRKGAAKKETGHKVMVYGIPPEWVELIHGQAMTFSGFAKIAIEEKLRRNGLLK